jgi:hypothetical protein
MMCGYCEQSSYPICLKKKNKQPESNCVGVYTFSLTLTAKSTASNPCTNHPMPCTLFPLDAHTKQHQFIWKYKIPEHLETFRTTVGQAIPPKLTVKIMILDEEVQAIIGKQSKAPQKHKNGGDSSGLGQTAKKVK